MTHLLPGGKVPNVHGAPGPVPPRLPLLATSRLMHYLATAAAGAYPRRRPPIAWSTWVSAPPGLCYWPRQWEPHGLARRLPSGGVGAWRGAPLLPWWVQCPVRVCTALAAGPGGFGAGAGLCVFPVPPLLPPVFALCVAGRPVQVSFILARWYAIQCALCVPRAWSGCPSGIPSVSFVCVCAHALGASASPTPLPGSLWRAHFPGCRCWAPVGRFHAVLARPRVLPRSNAQFGLPGGGTPRSCSPPCLACGCVPPLGRASASVAFLRRGGQGGAGLCALPRSVALPSLGRQQSGRHRHRSGHGGRGPHTAPVCVRVLSPGVVCLASLSAGAGFLACRCPAGSRRLGAWRRVVYRPCYVSLQAPRAFQGKGGLPPCF